MGAIPEPASRLSWFVAVPDSPACAAVAAGLRAEVPGLRVLSHASGRPWLLGRWQDGEVVAAAFGGHRLAVIGDHGIAPDDLLRMGRSAHDADSLCAAVAGQPGSFHVAASAGEQTALQGTVSGLRRVFHIRTAGHVVAGDRADVVAALAGQGVDEERMAVRLLSPYAPWPLFWQPVWRGVRALAPYERLVLTGAVDVRTRRRWQPPEPVLDLAGAAVLLREALTDAVEVRARRHPVIASDLSGTDSTSLCALAARTRTRVVGLTCVSPDPLDDDLPWATRAAAELGTVTHDVLGPDVNPLPYEGISGGGDSFDEPTAAVMYRAGFLAVSRRAAAHGAGVRLTGFGGDELLTADPALLLGLLRSHPRLAWQRLGVLRSAYRWGRRDTLRAVLDRRSYGDWMASLGDGLRSTESVLSRPWLGWGIPVTTAPWVSDDAVATVRRELHRHAAHAEPLAPDKGGHGRLAGIHAGAAMMRHLAQLSCRTGVPVAAPYLDDAVVTACLSVRAADITAPQAYKPLIRAAMAGIVPDGVLRRDTKADTSIAAARGADRYRDDLLDLAEDSRMAALGLVDRRALHAALRSPDDRTWYDLDHTLAGETWLRGLRAPAAA